MLERGSFGVEPQPNNHEEGSLRFINYFVSHGCNLQCPYCRVIDQKVKPMDSNKRREALRRISRLSSEHKILSVTGGEPTLDQDFLIDVISDGVDAGFYVTLATNGYGVDTKLIDRLGDLIQEETNGNGIFGQLGISVDCGYSEKTDLDKAMELLSYVRKKGMVPVVNTVFTSETDIGQFKNFVNYVLKKGIFIAPLMCSPSIEGGVYSGAPSGDSPTAAQLREIAPFLAWKKFSTGYITGSFGYLWTMFQGGFSNNKALWHCEPNFRMRQTSGRGFLTLDSDGYIGSCQEFPRVVNILNVPSNQLSLQFFDQEFSEVVKKCPGCYYGCYVNENKINELGLAMEALTALRMAVDLQGIGDFVHKFREGSKYYPFKDLSMLDFSTLDPRKKDK